MSVTDINTLEKSDLNPFLFAEIGTESSGMTLSVISALARGGLDPWLEAGRLARLPPTSAIEGLARLISAMPASLWGLPDARTIAARLVHLLPRRDLNAALRRPLSLPFGLVGFRWLSVGLMAALTIGFAISLSGASQSTGSARLIEHAGLSHTATD